MVTFMNAADSIKKPRYCRQDGLELVETIEVYKALGYNIYTGAKNPDSEHYKLQCPVIKSHFDSLGHDRWTRYQPYPSSNEYYYTRA